MRDRPRLSSGLSNNGGKKEEKKESGKLYNGRFFTAAEGNQLLIDNPDLAEDIIAKARPAIRQGGVVTEITAGATMP